jgi:hypothetical protein
MSGPRPICWPEFKRRFGGPDLNFNDPLNLLGAPATHIHASVTNLFYWTNLVHDVSYHYGFDEVSGNFQVENYTNKGEDTDAVLAVAQAAIAANNAFMQSTPDGIPPLLAMGVFTFFDPVGRDSTLDSEIIVHEYMHGITNRLTGGPANHLALQALQSGGMGEGWSDWMALVMTMDPADTRDTPREHRRVAFGRRRPAAAVQLRHDDQLVDVR